MDIKTRLTRKPVTTALWVILVTAMALLLGIGANLLHSADSLLAILDSQHTTIAVQTSQWGIKEEEIEELLELDTVETIDLRTLTGAYIPELTAQIHLVDWGTICKQDPDPSNFHTLVNDCYNEVILTGTVVDTALREIGIEGQEPSYNCSEIGGNETMYMVGCAAVIEVEKIVCAHPDYPFFETEGYSGYDGKVCVYFDFYSDVREADLAVNPLEIGKQYIFSGFYEPSCKGLGLGELSWPRTQGEFHPWLFVGERFSVPGASIDFSHLIQRDGRLVNYLDVIIDHDVWFTEGRSVPIAKVSDKVHPGVMPLEGSVEELLETDALWAQTVEVYRRQLHSFPVLGTQALETMYVFNQSDAVMIEGRSFTQEEYASGAKVCVISETAALTGGIRVGDTIHLSQYIVGSNGHEGNTSLYSFNDNELNNPAIGRFPPDEYITDQEEFIVVGIYQLQRSWDNSTFSITPNTIFIPQEAQIPGGYGGAAYLTTDILLGDMEFLHPNGTHGVYLSVKIRNGMSEEFLTQAGSIVSNTFKTFDQGYEAAQESVKAVGQDAWKMMGLAVMGWLLLMTLYLVLYQGSELHNLGIMRSLGAKPKHCARYLFRTGWILSAVGICLGTLLSSQATRYVSGILSEFLLSADEMLAMSGGQALGNDLLAEILNSSTLPLSTLLTLTAMQLAVMALCLWIHANAVAKKAPRTLLAA